MSIVSNVIYAITGIHCRPTIRPGLNVCPGVPSQLAKCPGISLQ